MLIRCHFLVIRCDAKDQHQCIIIQELVHPIHKESNNSLKNSQNQICCHMSQNMGCYS